MTLDLNQTLTTLRNAFTASTENIHHQLKELHSNAAPLATMPMFLSITQDGARVAEGLLAARIITRLAPYYLNDCQEQGQQGNVARVIGDLAAVVLWTSAAGALVIDAITGSGSQRLVSTMGDHLLPASMSV